MVEDRDRCVDPLVEARALLEASTSEAVPWAQVRPGVVATLEGVWQRRNARHSSAASEETDAALIAAAPRLLAALAGEVERSRSLIAAGMICPSPADIVPSERTEEDDMDYHAKLWAIEAQALEASGSFDVGESEDPDAALARDAKSHILWLVSELRSRDAELAALLRQRGRERRSRWGVRT